MQQCCVHYCKTTDGTKEAGVVVDLAFPSIGAVLEAVRCKLGPKPAFSKFREKIPEATPPHKIMKNLENRAE